MRKLGTVILTLALMISGAASAIEIDEIVFEIDNFSVESEFEAGGGIGERGRLTWSQGGFAILKHAAGQQIYRVRVSGILNDMTDLSVGGVAQASFDVGNLNVNLFALADPAKTTSIGSFAASLFSGFSYIETETAENPSELYGAAIVKMDSWSVPGYQWSELIGAMGGMTATTSVLTQINISDYQSDWDSDNTIVTLMADESGIPEPATIALLGLGGLALLKKRTA